MYEHAMLNNTIICGCARNCENYLINVFKNIERIRNLNQLIITHILVAYDESNDKTLATLCGLKREYPMLEIMINKEPLTTIRTQNICNARNKLMERMEEINKTQTTTYFIMMDFDDVCSKEININVLKDALDNEIAWNCVTFNNEQYYDFWALSIGPFQYSCWHWKYPHWVMRLMREYLTNALSKTPHEKYIKCSSAFNGFGIYKYSDFKEIRYKSLVDETSMLFYKLGRLRECINEVIYMINEIRPYTKTETILEEKINWYDCKHRWFHYEALQKNPHINIVIWKSCLFPKYNGEHSRFLYN